MCNVFAQFIHFYTGEGRMASFSEPNDNVHGLLELACERSHLWDAVTMEPLPSRVSLI